MAPVQKLPVTPSLQAERILAAWASGDKTRLRQELRKSQQLDAPAARGLDEERFELLQAVSEGMLRASDPLSHGRRDPAVRRCLDLLAHLAKRESVAGWIN